MVRVFRHTKKNIKRIARANAGKKYVFERTTDNRHIFNGLINGFKYVIDHD